MNDLTNNNEKKENKSNFSKNNYNRKPTTISYQDKISFDAWITLVILSLIGLVIVYGETMIIPAIPDLIQDFNIPYNTTSWILTAYLIAGAVSTPIVGKLSDIYGKKKVLLIIMAIFIVSIAAAGFSINISFLIASRIIQGVGLSMFIIALSILQ